MNKLVRIANDFRNPITLSVGVTATIGYGTLYYAFSVFAPVISLEFGVSLDAFFAVFAIGLLLGGFVAPFAGRFIDKNGARLVLTLGSVCAALALFLFSYVSSLWWFAVAIVLIEIAAALVLYEAVFAGLTQIYGQDGRRHITSVTLIGGFASTLFWPLTQFLVSNIGWRETAMVFAALHLVICAPLNWWAMGQAEQKRVDTANSSVRHIKEPVLEGAHRQRAYIFYAVAICVSGTVLAAFPVHMMVILQGQGVTAQTAALLAMVMGPAQVLARVVEMASEDKYTALAAGRVCLVALPAAIIFLLLPFQGAWMAAIFAFCYGAAQGLANIVRGTVPLQLFGSKGYGALVGKITAIRFALNAGAPFGFALLITRFSLDAALIVSLLMSTLATIVFWQLRAPKNALPTDEEVANPA